MKPSAFRLASAVLAVAVAVGSIPTVSASDAAASARLEGIVVGTDGRPAPAHGVLLVDDDGRVAGRAVSEADGRYRFAEVVPGEYGVALELPDGTAAPVVGGGLRLGDGELARRDVRLVATEGAVRLAPGNSPHGLVLWWVGLSPAAKTALVVGVVGGVWLLVDGTKGNDDESPASPVDPGR